MYFFKNFDQKFSVFNDNTIWNVVKFDIYLELCIYVDAWSCVGVLCEHIIFEEVIVLKDEFFDDCLEVPQILDVPLVFTWLLVFNPFAIFTSW